MNDLELGRVWREAVVVGGAVAVELEMVYEGVAKEIAARGPACWASGRCCNFEKTGHRLYVTGLEAAYAVVRHGPGVTGEEIAAAVARGGCPFQTANLCGMHEIKPLGCRVYFCDRSSTPWQNELSERALREIRAVHERWELPYRYGEWRGMLGVVRSRQ
jgi:Fe-S-cluster containining protein